MLPTAALWKIRTILKKMEDFETVSNKG